MRLKTSLNSHDRIMSELNFIEPDHVPLFLLLKDFGDKYDRRTGFSFGNFYRYDITRPFSFQNHIKRVEEVLNLGLDDTLRLEPPLGWAEEYIVEGVRDLKIKVDKVFSEDKKVEFLKKSYITPEGELSTVVRKTEDWPHGDNIPVFSDYSMSRTQEFLIKMHDDLKKFKYLLGEPTKDAYKDFKEEAKELKKAARRLGVVLEGGRSALGDSVAWLLGMENMIMAQYDNPELVMDLLDILCTWEERRAEIIISEGIEILEHSAWYEITDFWTPDMYRKMLKPKLARLVKLAKDSDIKFKYIITKSFAELMDEFLDLGIDSIMGVDPVQGNANLKFLKEKLGGKISMWGGINSAITLGRGTREEIERATAEAIKILAAGGGFILYPVDNLIADANPWDNMEIMINKWQEIGNYPIL
jgi:hypothetical protein